MQIIHAELQAHGMMLDLPQTLPLFPNNDLVKCVHIHRKLSLTFVLLNLVRFTLPQTMVSVYVRTSHSHRPFGNEVYFSLGNRVR